MFVFWKKKKKVNKQKNSIEPLIEGFNEEAYLEANLDVKEAVERKDFPNVEVYLEQFGLKRIEAGETKFHKDFEPFSENVYLEEFPEVNSLIQSEVFSSAFDHFCRIGYSKLLEQLHNTNNIVTPLKEPIPVDKSLIKDFDEAAYLDANPDVKAAIEQKDFSTLSFYMELFGLKRIEEGNGKFHKDFDPYNESHYLDMFLDVKNIVENKGFNSGFEHFVKCGYSEIIHGKRVWKNTEVIASSEKKLSKNHVFGKIESYEDGKIHGWIYSTEQDVVPLLLIDGKPCQMLNDKVSRPDISTTYGLEDDTVGFIAEAAFNHIESTDIELYALGVNSVVKLDESDRLSVTKIKPNTLKNLEKLRHISHKKESVLIVVWDVTHNPIGRAKVLYDSIKKDRPVAMVGFNFELASAEVWEPIMDVPFNLFSLHWSERELMGALIREMNIAFSTIWICKP